MGIRCCVMNQTAWCSGGKPNPHLMYSWSGPGSAWTNHINLPKGMYYHSMVCDQAHNAIWTLYNIYVYRYSVESGLWQTMPSSPDSTSFTQSVLCNNSQVIVTLGGSWGRNIRISTDTIVLTSTVTGQSMKSNITLPWYVPSCVSACVSP